MFRTTMIFAGILGTLGTPFIARAATNCTPGRVMILFDRSTSMYTDTIDGKRKWDIATAGLSQIVRAYDKTIEFGLDLFPAQQLSCSGGTVAVQPGLNNGMAITNALAGPVNNMFTPIGQAVEGVLDIASMAVTNRPMRYVVLVTDGHEDCPNAGDIEAHATIVDAVKALRAKGIGTYVVGFGQASNGDGVDALLLNQMAVAGGTAIMGCDPNGATPSSPNLCYYQADHSADLIAALDEIAVHISAEVCDGLDNNCDGKIDENLTESCSTPCGPGSQTCNNGTWTACTATMPQTEVCDGIDNNCNGVIDEGCSCQDGVTRACGVNKGECKPGTQTCTHGTWGDCMGGVGPSTEICDGKDNDCDGTTDPGCECIMGETRACGGPAVGVCKAGTQTCKADGTWADCAGSVGPSAEVCDGKDNNCNGKVDDEGTGEGGTANGLCGPNATCTQGHCVDKVDDANIAGGGLGCQIGTGGSASALLGGLFLVFGLALLRRRAR